MRFVEVHATMLLELVMSPEDRDSKPGLSTIRPIFPYMVPGWYGHADMQRCSHPQMRATRSESRPNTVKDSVYCHIQAFRFQSGCSGAPQW